LKGKIAEVACFENYVDSIDQIIKKIMQLQPRNKWLINRGFAATELQIKLFFPIAVKWVNIHWVSRILKVWKKIEWIFLSGLHLFVMALRMLLPKYVYLPMRRIFWKCFIAANEQERR